jgi:hypothetical protein
MLKVIIGGPTCGQKRLAGEAFLPQAPPTTFFQHTFLHLFNFCNSTKLVFAAPFAGLCSNTGKLGFALYGGKSSLYAAFF